MDENARERKALEVLAIAAEESGFPYFPDYMCLTGHKTTTAVFLSYIMHLASTDPCFCKTDIKACGETGLTDAELRSAKKTIKTLPFLEITVKGLPARTWYKIDPRAIAAYKAAKRPGVC